MRTNYPEWEPTYRRICEDMGIDPSSDETAVRVLKAVTVNLDLISDDDLGEMVGSVCTVMGAADRLEGDIASDGIEGTSIVAGSAASRVLPLGIVPDILVTDLDGEIGPQIEMSFRGTVTLIHAHGDNMDLVTRYAPEFRGPVVLTTQSAPCNTVYNFGGFTDGDRAVCMARHFGSRVRLLGFDFSEPHPKPGSDPAIKARKLRWAEEIIHSVLRLPFIGKGHPWLR